MNREGQIQELPVNILVGLAESLQMQGKKKVQCKQLWQEPAKTSPPIQGRPILSSFKENYKMWQWNVRQKEIFV